MSDILIKGMKIPSDCDSCFIPGSFCPLWINTDVGSRHPDCPLIELPPHGRCIDADEMFVEFVMEGQKSKRYKLGEKWELNGEEIRSVISRLPTIIPAEEGET